MIAALNTLRARWRAYRRQRIFIMPSRPGYGFAVLLIVMLLGAINYNNSLGHLLCFLLASLGHVAMYHSHRNLKNLSLDVTPLDPVFSGQPARFLMRIENPESRSRLQLEIGHRQQLQKRRFKPFQHFDPIHTVAFVAGNDAHSETLSIATHQRGWQALDTLRVASRYPLGLFYCWTLYPQTARILVYPAPRGAKALPLPLSGQAQRKQYETAGEEDFAGLRAYRPGEALHRVAWKSMARDDVMRSKQFASPQGAEITLRWRDVVDLTDDEDKLSQLCAWVVAAEHEGHRYGLDIPGVTLIPGHGSSHQHACLKALALYHG
jgi:uncharacterized protein (DUF58 family)